MQYWWVNQNQTFRQEIAGGYLRPFAPAPRLSPPSRLQVSWGHRMNPARISALRSGRFLDFVVAQALRHISKTQPAGGLHVMVFRVTSDLIYR
jgi:hypothetical protein